MVRGRGREWRWRYIIRLRTLERVAEGREGRLLRERRAARSRDGGLGRVRERRLRLLRRVLDRLRRVLRRYRVTTRMEIRASRPFVTRLRCHYGGGLEPGAGVTPQTWRGTSKEGGGLERVIVVVKVC